MKWYIVIERKNKARKNSEKEKECVCVKELESGRESKRQQESEKE